MAESIGRLISLIFRLESIPPYERAVAIVEQLSGIGGARSVGFGKDKILSLPDAISKAMAEHYKLNDVRANNMSVPADAAHADKSPPRPISNADICPSCGQSSYILKSAVLFVFPADTPSAERQLVGKERLAVYEVNC